MIGLLELKEMQKRGQLTVIEFLKMARSLQTEDSGAPNTNSTRKVADETESEGQEVLDVCVMQC